MYAFLYIIFLKDYIYSRNKYFCYINESLVRNI
nr:MAG TPA: hypothetical protein [Caudoviricetes sp.]